MEKILREVCEMYQISRRSIQEYEKAGILSPSSRTAQGYLLYDENARKRIVRIRLLQDIGFTLRELKEVIDGPEDEMKRELLAKLDSLQLKAKQLQETIKKGYELVDMLERS